MFTRHILAAAAIAMLATTFPAYAKNDPISLKPSSKWVVDYKDDYCRLMRTFGKGDDLVAAIFNRYGPTQSFQLTLAGKRIKTYKKRDFKLSSKEPKFREPVVEIQFGPNESKQEVSFFTGSLGEKMPAVIINRFRIAPLTEADEKRLEARKKESEKYTRFEPETISAEREASVKYIRAGSPLRREVLLETGSMQKPFAALDACINNLLTNWGIDVEKHKNLSRHARPASNYGRWVTTSDYPNKMLNQGQPALVEFRLSVDATGKASQCRIQATTRPKEFDAAVCKALMKRARFTPALDGDGNPINSYWRNTIRFQIFR